MLVAIHNFIYALSSGAPRGFSNRQRSHFTPVIPARGLTRQENCYNLKVSLGYVVRPCLNQPKGTTKTIIIFNRCFMIWHPIYATKLVFLSPEQSRDILCKGQAQRTGWGPPAPHLLRVHLTTLCLTCVHANEKGGHKAAFLEMQRRWDKKHHEERQLANWFSGNLNKTYYLIKWIHLQRYWTHRFTPKTWALWPGAPKFRLTWTRGLLSRRTTGPVSLRFQTSVTQQNL